MIRFIFCTILLLLLAFSVQAQDLDAILALNAAAQGGDRLGEVTSVRLQLHIKEPGFEVSVETRFEDPQWVDGVLVFMRQEQTNLDSGEWLGTTRVLSVEHDIPDMEILKKQG